MRNSYNRTGAFVCDNITALFCWTIFAILHQTYIAIFQNAPPSCPSNLGSMYLNLGLAIAINHTLWYCNCLLSIFFTSRYQGLSSLGNHLVTKSCRLTMPYQVLFGQSTHFKNTDCIVFKLDGTSHYKLVIASLQ